MILKASQRAGGNQLAQHLLNDHDNEHVTIHQLRGFAADDLRGAFQEAHAVSRGTKCKQYLFSLSLNPPKGETVREKDFERAADEAERRLGLTGQPRAIVFHEKEGRRHAHVVWSRIDADSMTAVNLPFFKKKLNDLARDLYLEHEWTLPEGLRTHGGKSPLNFTLDEWQQAKRLGRDPREIKDAIRDCWNRSDSAKALSHALEERGYYLAQGDRRGFVVVDTDGEVFSLSRYAGIKTKDVRTKLGEPDALPTVAQVKADLARSTTRQAASFPRDIRARHAHEVIEGKKALHREAQVQRLERQQLGMAQRLRREEETRARASRYRRGLAGLWDAVTGRKRQIRLENEAATTACAKRDAAERDAMAMTQVSRRAPLQNDLDRTRRRHAEERRLLARQIAEHRRRLRQAAEQAAREAERPTRAYRRGLSLDL
ncbi:relaxase/mobilization nuclease domain-containing protein [Sphingomonas sp. HITSZ_GF]|uniref:relaxase/mobilization nuclease domain-containing protein n=1 Tax=Sphingomonas sp. HITSZ_GF TaxID=3037247 RepID=UPI00240DFFA2|nr:relaxase/mobilization nuclease domain-containing protein [Sphingomonas sp. HITSZ_GF]MDG2532216.1 relaxase/mobilization nuclease domain-containing protein [Sphingomonas sp. HITSZ_GF]